MGAFSKDLISIYFLSLFFILNRFFFQHMNGIYLPNPLFSDTNGTYYTIHVCVQSIQMTMMNNMLMRAMTLNKFPHSLTVVGALADV